MKITFLSTTILFVFLLSFSSCQNCKQCSGSSEIEQYVDGTLVGTTTAEVSGQEYCGDQLDMIDTGSPVESEVTQEVGGITQRVVTKTTYTCE